MSSDPELSTCGNMNLISKPKIFCVELDNLWGKTWWKSNTYYYSLCMVRFFCYRYKLSKIYFKIKTHAIFFFGPVFVILKIILTPPPQQKKKPPKQRKEQNVAFIYTRIQKIYKSIND